MDDYCNALTKEGVPCKNKAQLVHDETGIAVCNVHTPMCENFFTKYKKVCRVVWNDKCIKDMTTSKLKSILKSAEECRDLRIYFQNDCCKGKIERGHLGAIERMERIAKKCDNEISKRNGGESMSSNIDRPMSAQIKRWVPKRK